MKVIHVLSGISNPSAGPTYSVGSLAEHMQLNRINVKIIANGAAPSNWPHDCQYQILGDGSSVSELFSISILRYMKESFSSGIIAHGHGIWRMANLFPLVTDSNAKGHIVWSPRGMMSEWCLNNGKFKKDIYWNLFQKNALKKVDCFHATSQSEYEDIRRCGFRQPVAIIPNGISVYDDSCVKKNKSILFLSRITPKKGIDILLHAWSRISPQFSEWKLIIAGPLDNQYAIEMQALAKELNVTSVVFVGEVLAEQKAIMFCEASIFVLPSHSENFGLVVAESLAHGVPVITTTTTPWEQVLERNCGWVIEPDVSELDAAIRHALALPYEVLAQMGNNGRQWMQQDFSWPSITEKMLNTYKWLQIQQDKPDYIYLD